MNWDNVLEDGLLSRGGMGTLQVTDIGAQIQAGLGVDVNDVTTSEVTLVTLLIDDSASIRAAGNEGIVRNGHNFVIDALKDARAANGILAHCRYLNGTVLYPYDLIERAPLMTNANYHANGSTPLYDQTVVTLGTVVAKIGEFEGANVPARAITLIVTDGADMGSRFHTASSVRPLVEDLLRREDHIVAGLGISDGCTDFRQVFTEMGVPDAWILTPANSEKEIRAAFRLFSQSAVRASQAAVLGGFGN